MRVPTTRTAGRGRSATLRVVPVALAVAWTGFAALGAAPGPDPRTATQLFPTSVQCTACHNGLVTPSGTDVSIGVDWRASMMANSARDPYWQAAVRRETVDHPEAADAIEDECAACHMPGAHFAAHAAGGNGAVFAHLPAGRPAGGPAGPLDRLALDGVSCSVCHQIRAEGFGEPESFSGGFAVDTTLGPGPREAFGPFAVEPALARVMESATGLQPVESPHVQQAELCATCHTLFTHTLGPGGEVVGRLPEQVPYLEWRHSDYRDAQSCQDCHLPVLDEPAPLASVLASNREGFSRHVFRGGNFLVPRMMSLLAADLGVEALPQDLASASQRTLDHLKTAAALLSAEASVGDDGRLDVVVRVENLAGHKLPTAYPSRRAWLHLQVWDGGGRLVFESGRLQEDGAIEGNDNDADPRRYEPHYQRIESADQVQVYESILAQPDGTVTTGLLAADHYVKDNRVLPVGFEKATAAEDIAVQGAAADDPDFEGGADAVRYAPAVGDAEGPFRVVAELWYQPISFRWAENHREYPQAESERFLGAWEATRIGSAVQLARAEAATPGG